MIRFIVKDPVAPVDLLKKYHSHQLVREGHIGEAELHVGPGKHLGRKPQRAADHKGNMARAADAELFEMIRKSYGIVFLPVYRESDHIVVIADILQYPLALFFLYQLLFMGRSLIGGLLVRDFDDLGLAIARKALNVLVHSL